MTRSALPRQAFQALRRLVGPPPGAAPSVAAAASADPVAAEPALAPPGPPLAPPPATNENPDPVYAAVEAALRAKGYLRD
jgi:hypothetical protein